MKVAIGHFLFLNKVLMHTFLKTIPLVTTTLLSICITVYSQNPDQVSVHINDLQSITVEQYELQISELLYVQPVGDYYVIVHRNQDGVSVMNGQGELKTQLGSTGRGPFEWQSPAFIEHHDGEIIIWDAGNLKFLIYDEDFEPVREEYGIQYSIRGFSRKDQNVLAAFDQPGNENKFVYIYENESNGRFTINKTLGTLSEEGRMMLYIEMIGGVLWNGGDLLWVDPAVPGFFVYSTENESNKKVTFHDEHFSVESWDEPPGMTQRAFQKLEKYLFSNSRVVSIQAIKEHILIEVEHFQNGDPVITYHLFDFKYNNIGKVEAGEGGWMNYIRGVEGNRLYYWGEDYMETGLNRSIRVREIVVS